MATRRVRTANDLAKSLRQLRLSRYERKAKLKALTGGRLGRSPRLASPHRQAVLAKTAGRCHICGGTIRGRWQADHVLPRAGGGAHAVDNYLPAHDLCNNYRWDYSAEEFQWILKIGVWTRDLIERRTKLGLKLAERFVAREKLLQNRLAKRRRQAAQRQ